MRFEILGPIRVHAGAEEVAVTAARERVLLAMLVLHAGSPVSVPQLVEATWNGEPPDNARSQIHGCVWRLRRQLAAAGASDQVVVTEPAGYRLQVDSHEVDVREFRRLRDRARTAAAAGQGAEASDHYRAALGLWRGSALAGVDSDLVRQTGAGLDEERIQLLEECIRVELGLSRAGELVAELTELVRRYPYREGLHGALMLALYRTGRQAESLAAYRDARRVLSTEIGVEPGSELQQLHQAILHRDPDLDAAPAAQQSGVPRPRELPPDVTGFTGREDTLQALDELLPGGTEHRATPLPIAVVTGTAGVGKTALAVHWAHRVADRFPDGQLYVDLGGHSQGPPVRPVEALARLLRSLGTPPDQIPTDQTQATARYRSQLADRRALVVLDNAGTVDQVRPLLPGSPGCLVLVTSRDRLTGLVARDGARRVLLAPLPPGEARTLLARLLGPEWAGSSPESIDELARACAYLPLALRIGAANLTHHPGRTVAGYTAELTAGDRLAAMEADGDEETALRATFDLSYRSIPVPAQRLFRLLGLVPGRDFTATAAAALAGTPVAAANQLLARLARAHLLEELASDRYTFHDLLRDYAGHLTTLEDGEAERAAAVERLLGWYLHSAYHAVTTLYSHMMPLPPPPADLAGPRLELAAPGEALAWLDAERANLVAATAHAAERGPLPLAWQLAGCLRRYFSHNQQPLDWQTVATAAVTAAAQEGDARAQAGAELGLADFHFSLARYPDAIRHYDTAVTLAREAHSGEGEITGMINLGRAYQNLGDLDRAADHLADVVAVSRRHGSLNGEAIATINLGCVTQERGRLAEAVDQFRHALTLLGQLGHKAVAAGAERYLGSAYHELGRLTDAYAHLTHALAVHEEVGNRVGAAIDRTHLAAVGRDAGRLTDALDLVETAVAETANDPENHAHALNTLGSVRRHLELPRQAVDHHRRALDLAVRTGGRRAETAALLGIAVAENQLGQHPSAEDHANRALELARRVGYQVYEGLALTALAEVHLGRGELERAREHAQCALDSHRHTGHRLGEARALLVLGQIRHATDGAAEAGRCWRTARDVYAEIGAPVPAALTDAEQRRR